MGQEGKQEARLSVRLTTEQLQAIHSHADEEGMAFTDYVRKVLLGEKAPRSRLKVSAQIKPELIRLLGRLGGIGSDINNLSHLASQQSSVLQTKQFEQIHKEIMALLAELRVLFR